MHLDEYMEGIYAKPDHSMEKGEDEELSGAPKLE
jgi:hypothetical protein